MMKNEASQDRINAEHPENWGTFPGRVAIRKIVEDVIPDWIRKRFTTLYRTFDGRHYAERHGTAHRVDLLQTPGLNRKEKMAYTRALRKKMKRFERSKEMAPLFIEAGA